MRTPIDPGAFRRARFSSNPPHAPYVFGWYIRLRRPTKADERQWLREHGYTFCGGKWSRSDAARKARAR